MLERLFSLGGILLRHTGKFDRIQWTILFTVALVIGIFCTRGYGSRNNY